MSAFPGEVFEQTTGQEVCRRSETARLLWLSSCGPIYYDPQWLLSSVAVASSSVALVVVTLGGHRLLGSLKLMWKLWRN